MDILHVYCRHTPIMEKELKMGTFYEDEVLVTHKKLAKWKN